ncbi:MAG: DUF1553 domain-containing protein [Verrucomicrobiaceae bacterium]|nr:DUF1553 domain-containing protein [Verrucomicrobiaceae bacterium]
MRISVFSLTFTAILVCLPTHAAGKLKFNRDIRPILSDKCFHCHGFDPKKREADLRLDQREAAIEAKAIIPGKADESEAIKRILATDDDHMPPLKAKLGSLTPAEIATLKQWINEGAEYEEHWAFVPLPVQGSQLSVHGSIDEIVSAGLKERGLNFQPEAAAETLIRRLSFDLTGLPPTPEEVAEFTQSYRTDPTENRELRTGNYAKLVDRLLASQHYGERMAVDWLDVSRYADSYGFQVDRDREVWPWRDWVVKAFNENLPFDKFVTWQIAGDMLPNPTDEQRLATMFSRLHMQESEGGSVEEEYRVEYVCDRVQTFATAFLGLTFECARCHDHKFDPISQKDFYGLFGMFQNIDEAGLYSFFTPTPPTPAMMMTDEAQRKKLSELRATVAKLERSAGTPASTNVAVQNIDTKPLASFTFDALDKGNKLANAIDAKKPATLKGENELVEGRSGKAIKFSGDDAVDLPLGNFHSYDPFSVSLWLKTPDVKDRAVVFHRSRAWTDAASRGYELLIIEGKLQWSLIHFWPGNAISIRAKEPLKLNEWTQVVVTNDGSSKASGLHLYVNGKLAKVEIVKDQLTRDITGGGGDNIALGERFRDRGFKGGLIDDFAVYGSDLSAEKESSKELYAARAELVKFTDTLKDMMVMQELPKPKTAYILFRGEYDKRKEPVPDAVPSWIAKMPAGAPNNRLGVAQWLTSPQHPLFARVTVNRIWQGLFGRGLVKTSEDFGSQGTRPLYPELLDYLAVKFMQSGWDTKALIKEIVMSKVYRQRSIADAKTMADDPENEWLARGPRFRLPAEMIRDNALVIAGLLKPQLGGAPVNPYEMSEAFKPANPSDTNRRSLYTTWRRTSPPPAMVTFDAPRRGVCIAKRERTDSPLQALILLNGTQYVEAARVLGEKLHEDAGGDVAKMIEQGFLRCLNRKPDAKEIAICTRLYQEQLEHFKRVPKEAEATLKIGSAKRDAKLPLPEAAAAAVLGQALLNHDECVVKR